MRALNEIGRAAAEELGMSILEGEAVTDAHWFGSWDGLHYSEMMHHFINQDPRWYGGVSATLSISCAPYLFVMPYFLLYRRPQ
jgi:hypothetical protein